MQDRVSLYPGRVKLVPVAGQENTYDMVRADSPTQEGTPLNKDSLLKDATAALLGGDSSMLPDEALVILKTLVDNAQTSADEKAKIQTGSYVGTGTYGESNPNSLTFDFEPKLIMVSGTGNDYYYHRLIIPFRGYGFAFISSQYSSATGGAHGVAATFSGNTVSWYNIGGSGYQFNGKNVTYVYCAIG